MLVGVLDHIKGALEVDADDRVKILFVHVEHQLVAGDTGVVDQYVDAAEVRDDRLDRLFGGFKVGDVAKIRSRFDAVGSQLRDRVVALGFVADIQDRNISAVFGKLFGDSQPDAARAAGDDRRFIF